MPEYQYDPSSYNTRVYQGFGKGDYDALLKLGPNIKDWPEIAPLGENLLLKVASYITDPVTTTDELIPSGETSSFRSNPLGLAEFTLSRKDPEYVGRAKAVQAEEKARRAGEGSAEVLAQLHKVPGCEALTWDDVQIASTIFAVKPGDGSAREQAASCQRVLGAGANIVTEYATKRYRSSTGVCCRCSWWAQRPSVWAIMCSSPTSAKLSRAICRTSRPMCWAIPSRSSACTWPR